MEGRGRKPRQLQSKGQEERLRQEAREAAQQESKETGDRGPARRPVGGNVLGVRWDEGVPWIGHGA